ncbi:hypothetical protein CEXT_44511 [Caerostris extrusa]|uniref:Uncharacterized protein n=1 Tax=Caerostris extrusa TaxID=172846 RepID=A0AAV4Y6I1_CAEEX|nr:hypothetical protein CEXT_44511 [Caerostris extrusa]
MNIIYPSYPALSQESWPPYSEDLEDLLWLNRWKCASQLFSAWPPPSVSFVCCYGQSLSIPSNYCSTRMMDDAKKRTTRGRINIIHPSYPAPSQES